MTYPELVLILGLMMGAGALQAAPSNDPYSAGLAAARSGAWEDALEHFQTAQQSGMDKPTLTYNLGVTYLKLERFEEAAGAFQRLSLHDEWRALAYYNLGLVEERRGRDEAARRHFEQARDAADLPKLRALAERRLRPLPVVGEPTGPRWAGVASFAGGYDDNVLLANDALIDDVSGEADAFGELLAAARRPITSSGNTTIDLAGYHRAHADLDDYDFGSVSMALLWHRWVQDWHFSTGLIGAAQFAGGESYANVIGHRVEAEHGRGPFTWSVRNDLDYYFSGSSFEFIEGWRNKTRLELANRFSGGRLKGGYEFEINNRDDLESGNLFSSYSPRRHRFYAGGAAAISERVDVELLGGVSLSDYDDPNRFLDEDGALIEQARDQDKLFARLRLNYRLSRRWHVWSQYQYNDSASEISRYDYANAAYMLGLETLF